MTRTFRARVLLPLLFAVVGGSVRCGSDQSGGDPPADTDGDGLSDIDEVKIYGTSPVLRDTDGDGISDGDEVIKYAFDPDVDPYRFNPRVADVPELNLDLTSAPVVAIQLTDSSGVSQTFETTKSMEQSQTNTTGTMQTQGFSDTEGTSDSFATEIENTFTTMPGTAVSDSITQILRAADDGGVGDAGADGGGGGSTPAATTETTTVTNTIDPSVETDRTINTTTVDSSTTVDTSNTLTQLQANEYSETLAQAQSYTESHTITEESANLKVTATITNEGRLAFRLTNMLLTAVVHVDSNPIPVGNLAIDTPYDVFQPIAFSPGEKMGPLNFLRAGLSLQTAQVLLDNIRNLVIQLTAYEITDSDGKPFAFDLTEVSAKTATVIIDYGGRRLNERYLVATNLDPGHPGVALSKVLREILRIPFQTERSTGLVVVRDVGALGNAGDGGAGTGKWIVEDHSYTPPEAVSTGGQADGDGDDAGQEEDGGNDGGHGSDGLDDLQMRVGDIVRMTWVGP